MKTVYCAKIENWDGNQELVAIDIKAENVDLWYRDGIQMTISIKGFLDQVKHVVCICGAPLNSFHEQHSGRCEKHLPIYDPNESEWKENFAINDRYEDLVKKSFPHLI